ncbi:hypothetical protein [Nitrosomonas sp. Is37]|uniref:hypothetical protein n=1 Tax=Nitrosomonas sp. Is37 TaxID=3080535 RepID=UPI00294B54BB|nr:hypothetical protein [Nitrosomonas sp. Is37]MDV6343970.1 hypothetical protein [Nitrosomonas sp. Is37]
MANLIEHGNVVRGSHPPQLAFNRYVAVIDVLGMKEWLTRAPAHVIAEQLDYALEASEQSSCGKIDNQSYGPLIGTTHFSDSLLAWSPDDSWASLAVLCEALKLIVATALESGVPLRGSIAHGEAVCNKQMLRFVGQPIAEAYLWSEKTRPYRSVGVDLTPCSIATVRRKLVNEPLPACWSHTHNGISQSVLTRSACISEGLIWYRDCLFVNHWAHGIFTGADPSAMFLRRGLKDGENSRKMLAEMMKFFEFAREEQKHMWMADDFTTQNSQDFQTTFNELAAQLLFLEQVRNDRDPF